MDSMVTGKEENSVLALLESEFSSKVSVLPEKYIHDHVLAPGKVNVILGSESRSQKTSFMPEEIFMMDIFSRSNTARQPICITNISRRFERMYDSKLNQKVQNVYDEVHPHNINQLLEDQCTRVNAASEWYETYKTDNSVSFNEALMRGDIPQALDPRLIICINNWDFLKNVPTMENQFEMIRNLLATDNYMTFFFVFTMSNGVPILRNYIYQYIIQRAHTVFSHISCINQITYTSLGTDIDSCLDLANGLRIFFPYFNWIVFPIELSCPHYYLYALETEPLPIRFFNVRNRLDISTDSILQFKLTRLSKGEEFSLKRFLIHYDVYGTNSYASFSLIRKYINDPNHFPATLYVFSKYSFNGEFSSQTVKRTWERRIPTLSDIDTIIASHPADLLLPRRLDLPTYSRAIIVIHPDHDDDDDDNDNLSKFIKSAAFLRLTSHGGHLNVFIVTHSNNLEKNTHLISNLGYTPIVSPCNISTLQLLPNVPPQTESVIKYLNQASNYPDETVLLLTNIYNTYYYYDPLEPNDSVSPEDKWLCPCIDTPPPLESKYKKWYQSFLSFFSSRNVFIITTLVLFGTGCVFILQRLQ